MGHLIISHLIDGREYAVTRFDASNERILNAFALHDKYNWRLIQEIPFDVLDLSLTVELAGKETIDWNELGVPTSVVATINEVQGYQDAYNEIYRLSKVTQRASIQFAHDIRINAKKNIDYLRKFKIF